VDLFLIPFQILFILLFIFRIPLAGKIFRKNELAPFLSDIQIRYENVWRTIVFPVAIIFSFYLIWVGFNLYFFHHSANPAPIESIPVLMGENLFLAPISEQIIQCVFLSFVFVASEIISQNKLWIRLMNGIALIFVSLILAIGHSNFTPISLVLLFSLFMIYGGIFYKTGRNLLPAVIAHATWNLIAVVALPF